MKKSTFEQSPWNLGPIPGARAWQDLARQGLEYAERLEAGMARVQAEGLEWMGRSAEEGTRLYRDSLAAAGRFWDGMRQVSLSTVRNGLAGADSN